MKAKFAIVAIAIFLLPAIAVATVTATPTQETVHKIGFIYPVTGALSSIQTWLLNGAKAGAYRVNTTYGFNVELVLADSTTASAGSATAAQTLLDKGVKVVVGADASGATQGAAGVLSQARVPLISYSSTSPAITAFNDSDYLFRVVASDLYQGVA